jgi:hypothetical protein
MNEPRPKEARGAVLWAVATLLFLTLLAGRGSAQGGGYERTFAESKAAVEKVLKEMQPSLSGRLPVLDGFALAGDHSLDHYQRGYFQSAVQVSSTASGGSVVHVTTKVTAWYSDSIPSRSGYQLLNSNGRLEGDLLDQLAEKLKSGALGTATAAARAPATELPSAAASTQPATQPLAVVQPQPAQPQPAQTQTSQTQTSQTQTSQPQPARQPQSQPQPADSAPSAPTTPLPETGGTFSASLAHGLAAERSGATEAVPTPPADGEQRELKAEADSLEEILKNQSHPKNLVAVRKSGTPVVATASLTAKTLFLASAHDEFEMLDFNPDWVHVRISGLSRGWIWRNSLEMPEGIPDLAVRAGSAPAPTADELFRVSREETGSFPGDWEPLRNKSVKIISVQKTDEAAPDGGAKLKLEFAKSVLDKSYAELAKKTDSVAGIVLIFDSADGGMIAATVATLQQWKAGTLSDSALWHQCYFDPPEFGSAGPSASQ